MPRQIVRYEELTPEQRKRVDAARAAARTPERQAEEERIRAQFADRPSWAELIRRGEIDPERVLPSGSFWALLGAVAALKAERGRLGLALEDVSKRTGLAVDQLVTLESGRNPNPTFETLARYAAGLGLTLGVVLKRPEGAEGAAEAVGAGAGAK